MTSQCEIFVTVYIKSHSFVTLALALENPYEDIQAVTVFLHCVLNLNEWHKKVKGKGILKIICWFAGPLYQSVPTVL